MIHLEHIAFAYPGRGLVLADVSLEVPAGGMVCLFGPSGCGKSTTLAIAAGLRQPRSGRRHVVSRRIGYAFQEPRLLPWRSVRENLLIGLSGWLHAAAARDAADLWLERLGLVEASGKLPAELSGGMRRRVNLARALGIAPEVLLLDEPFAFLDAAACRQVAEGIRERQAAGAAVLMVSHQRDWADDLGSRIIELSAAPLRIG